VGWKLIKGKHYYYRSVRDGGRVRSEYVGGGEFGELVELIERTESRLRAAEAGEAGARRAGAEAADRAAAGTFAGVEAVVAAALEAADYHRPRRGNWRRRRMGADAEEFEDLDPDLPPPPAPLEEIRDVVDRAAGGDRSAMPRLRELFRADPKGMLKMTGGDLSFQIENYAIRGLVGKNIGAQEAIGLRVKSIRDDLAGPDPTALELLLVDRIALCWLDLHIKDFRRLHREGLTWPEALCEEKIRDRSHHRYLAAIKALATVRRLGAATIQVRIDRLQANVVGAAEVNVGAVGAGPAPPDGECPDPP
jgi:hypothetical protein